MAAIGGKSHQHLLVSGSRRNQKARFVTTFSLLLSLSMSALMISGCGEVEREEPDGSSSSSTARTEANRPPAHGLRLIQQDHGTALPAKVSVTFKLETDTGVPVPNLPVDSFNLYENDNLISVESARRVTPQDGEFVFSTLLLLDFSGSVVFGSLDTIKSAAASFVENVLPPAATEQTSKSLALAIFDGRQNIVMISDYLTNPDQVKEFIFALDASTAQDPSTNLYGAAIEGIAAISAQVEQQRTLNPDILSAGALVLFTDGTDQAARTTKEAAIQAVEARPEDVSVMTIGLGSEINPQVLQQLGRDAFSQASELNELTETFSEVAQFVSDEADSFYKLDYCSPKRAGMENTLRIQAIQGDLTGELNVVFSAEGFSAGCKI